MEGYRRLFQDRGASFRFDYWRVPDSLKQLDTYLGSHESTYGESSDHHAEILPDYGAVLPGGVGAPRFQGYPLGLVWRFEAFNFNEAWLQGVVFWRATVINRSADVYGAGVSYDSLYLGFNVGTGGGAGGGGSAFSNYYQPEISTALYHQSGSSGPVDFCAQAVRIPTGVSGCGGGSGNPNGGYNNGGSAIVVLKSPIGDLRNKLFSRTAEGTPCQVGTHPFCDPAHPLRGDTITFNHGHMCGFGGCWASTHNVSDKRSFGMLSSVEATVLDGRDPATLGAAEAWRTFRNAGYPAIRGTFNKYVPGLQGPPAATWDWNKDGNPDTLYFDSCAANGCVTPDADTMPGGQINAYGNVGGVLAAGPFSLAAGDSTSWYVAFIGQRDSTSTWSAIYGALDAYLWFFPRAAPPPAPRILATQTSTTNAVGREAAPVVNLLLDAGAERWVDPYLLGLADRAAAAPVGTVMATPGLSGELRARSADNVEAVEIYKSCDGGRTFTGDDDCTGDHAVDTYGQPIGSGWRSYAVLHPVAGDLPNQFTDSAVVAGRSYTYIVVVKSRGAVFPVIRSDRAEEVEFAPSLRSAPAVTDAGPAQRVTVYVPASREAAGVGARISLTEAAGGATVPFEVTPTDSAPAGGYVARFGNLLEVERDSVASTGEIRGTRVGLRYVVRSAPLGDSVVLRSHEYDRDGPEPLAVAGTPTRIVTNQAGPDRWTVTDRYQRLGFVVADAAGRPLFASTALTGTSATPDRLLGSANDRGFVVFADNTLDGVFAEERYRSGEDTVPRSPSPLMVQWREQNASLGSLARGVYRVRWFDEAFGLPRGIIPNRNDPAATARELAGALRARPDSSVGLTDSVTASLTGVPQTDLVAVKAPFTIENLTFGGRVDIAMARRTSDTWLLGVGPDTVRVAIPIDEWVPGDLLHLLETRTVDSTDANQYLVLSGGEPIRVARRARTFSSAVFGCADPRLSCNPVAIGASGYSGYRPIQPGDVTEFHYYRGFSPESRYGFTVEPMVAGNAIPAITEADLARIRVVPNPFVLYSAYQESIDQPRVIFTNMPPAGTLRIYTVNARFVQQVTWTPADLLGSGDLHVLLRAHSGNLLASGLYVWVLTAPSVPDNPNRALIRARGKFVVIQAGGR
jgi:hypothetical protein